MDRNSILGLVIIGGILIIFTVWNSPNKKEMAETQRKADSIAFVQLKERETRLAETTAKSLGQSSKNVGDSVKSVKEKQIELKNNFGSFSEAVEGKNEFYTIENDLVKITISRKGGRPYSAELKKYKTYDKKSLILFNGDSTVFGMNFFSQNRTISTNNLYFQPQSNENQIIVDEKDTAKTFALRLSAGKGQYIEYVYKLKPKSYMVDLNINLVKMDSIISRNSSTIDLNWKVVVPCLEKVKTTENGYTSVYYKFNQDEVDKFEISAKENAEKSQNLRNRIKWVAYKQQFFSSVLIAGNFFENATIKSTNILDSTRYLKTFDSEIGLPYNRNSDQSLALSFYFGPNHYQTLKKYKLDMEELVSLGSWIIKWINRFLIIPVFNFLNIYIASYGLIIFLLTIFIKLIFFPLTYRSYVSMAKMRVLKPQIDEINAKIPADKAMERQQEVMKLYKKVGVNPLGGCLPLLLQMPILIAMFRFFPTSIELRQQGFLWATDLSSYDSIFSWTTYIPLVTPYFGNHISMFNLLMTGTTIITIRMNNQATASSQQFPGMQFMTYLMPVMFMFILNNFSSGLTYYYFLANVITIIQNEVFKRSIDEEKLLLQLNENKKKTVKKSKFQEKLEEAAKRRGIQTKR
jgi:YidC/Oxa1 family membrane protein insertase